MKKRLKWIRIFISTLQEMIEAETKYLKSLKPGNANFFIKVLDNSCGYIMTCCLSPAASVIYWKRFKTDHLLQLIILIQKPIWIKTMNSDRDSGEHFSLSFFCDYTWQRHKLKRKQWRRGRKKCQRKANWTTAKERGGMVADNGDTELSKHEGRKRERK